MCWLSPAWDGPQIFNSFGVRTGTWTQDPLIKSQMLLPSELYEQYEYIAPSAACILKLQSIITGRWLSTSCQHFLSLKLFCHVDELLSIHFSLAPVQGFEPWHLVLETSVLPIDTIPIILVAIEWIEHPFHGYQSCVLPLNYMAIWRGHKDSNFGERYSRLQVNSLLLWPAELYPQKNVCVTISICCSSSSFLASSGTL